MSNIHDAKKALDELIGKARIHLYKPIQVAEILYHHRTQKNINLLNLEDYRNKSKQWRDEISLLLLGRVCTSSAKYQDNLFEKNALPPELLNILGTRLFRVGVTNAADRGIDMYSNWGPAIQIKHLALDEELAEDIVKSISSDRIVIVCKEAEQKIIVSLLNQIGWKSKIQSVITEDELISWYDKALRGKYAKLIGDKLLTLLSEEINNEFPSIDRMPHILSNRNYEIIKDSFWK